MSAQAERHAHSTTGRVWRESPGEGSKHPLAGQEMTGADMVIQVLADEGVDVLFGYSGGAILPTWDALARYNIEQESKQRKPIELVVPANEQGAGFMAAGYARVELSVYVDNQRATSLYERLGWRPCGLPTAHPGRGSPSNAMSCACNPRAASHPARVSQRAAARHVRPRQRLAPGWRPRACAGCC